VAARGVSLFSFFPPLRCLSLTGAHINNSGSLFFLREQRCHRLSSLLSKYHPSPLLHSFPPNSFSCLSNNEMLHPASLGFNMSEGDVSSDFFGPGFWLLVSRRLILRARFLSAVATGLYDSLWRRTRARFCARLAPTRMPVAFSSPLIPARLCTDPIPMTVCPRTHFPLAFPAGSPGSFIPVGSGANPSDVLISFFVACAFYWSVPPTSFRISTPVNPLQILIAGVSGGDRPRHPPPSSLWKQSDTRYPCLGLFSFFPPPFPAFFRAK